MLDEIFKKLEGLGTGWEQEAERRRAISKVDPVADTLEYNASELKDQLRELRITRYWLTVPEFAAMQNPPVTPSAVRQWIARGELVAQQGENGHYQIARDAKRVRRARQTA